MQQKRLVLLVFFTNSTLGAYRLSSPLYTYKDYFVKESS